MVITQKSSTFSDIHEKLESLNNEISVLEKIYLTDYNSDEEFDHETNYLQVALKRYQKMKAISQNKSNLYLLKIIDASMHATEFKNGIQKKYLTTKYKFKGISVCQTPKIYGLTGHVSNN
ncbi:33439_t:CDS:2, partial [Gigaspora margarita]